MEERGGLCVCVGGLVITLAVLQCGAVQNCHSEPKIHLEREDKGGRRKDGDMRQGKERRSEDKGRLWRDAEMAWRV